MKKVCLVISALLVISLLAVCSGGAAQQSDTSAAKPEVSADGNADSAAVSSVIEPEQLISKEEAAQFAGAVKDGEKKEQPR